MNLENDDSLKIIMCHFKGCIKLILWQRIELLCLQTHSCLLKTIVVYLSVPVLSWKAQDLHSTLQLLQCELPTVGKVISAGQREIIRICGTQLLDIYMTRGTRYGWNVSGRRAAPRRAICTVSALQELVLYNLSLTFRIVFGCEEFRISTSICCVFFLTTIYLSSQTYIPFYRLPIFVSHFM